VVQNVGGLAGRLAHAEVSNISVDMTVAFLDGAEEDLPSGELDRRLTIPPNGSRLSTVGLLTGSGSNVTASTITTTGTIQSEVKVSTVGGVAGTWRESSTLSQSRADVAIRVGGGARNVTPQLESVAGIGGIFGSLSDSEANEVAATGLINIQLAADAGINTTVNSLGGFVGATFDGSSMSDILVSTTTTISIHNPNNEPTVSVSEIGGVLGRAGALRNTEESQLSDDLPPEVARGLAVGGIDLSGVSAPTDPVNVNAFIGRRATVLEPAVSDSYWGVTQYPSLTDAFAEGKTDEALGSLSTYANWSIAPSWNQGDTTWGLCQSPKPSLPFLQWMTASNPCSVTGATTSPESSVQRAGTEPGKMQVGPIQFTFGARVGDAVAGTATSASGSGMMPGSTVQKEVRSTPTMVSQVTVQAGGDFQLTGALPNLAEGNHRFIINGLDGFGTPWQVTLPFGVDTNGRFAWIGSPTFSQGALLAATGPPVSGSSVFLAGAVFVLAGLALLYRRRHWTGQKSVR
jgi:hypothetical protein